MAQETASVTSNKAHQPTVVSGALCRFQLNRTDPCIAGKGKANVCARKRGNNLFSHTPPLKKDAFPALCSIMFFLLHSYWRNMIAFITRLQKHKKIGRNNPTYILQPYIDTVHCFPLPLLCACFFTMGKSISGADGLLINSSSNFLM